MTSEPTNSNQEKPTPSFEQAVQALLADLLYPSESDEPVELVTCPLDQKEPLSDSQIKDWLMLAPSTYIEEIAEDDFWAPVVEEEDWYDDDEKLRTQRFSDLKRLLDEHLTDRQVFRVGDTEVDIYLLGRTPEGSRAGIKTKVVET